ncbi:4'-phosphopantetheinyl transferase superfamily protein [Komarekiella sp. 'clone 1']|uniref:4'-phosphopantetheinyl transferase superfamily protein n=1 Tax=Komarekiella delphini-convector SJRDD-AB1 TaxID=2593771 RepID=A0AA40STD3_9NOST|nr:4'-phosphopantetheinyl transferase HetI [Komarekiella delphini-convector]MBD6614638.1 4'-phosphopantetheinyl transferase superfamily protein [Komarekiella delphini-convector SJRDD-AB1]
MTALNHLWLPAPTDLTLLPNDVHVWQIDLDQPEQQLQYLAATLSSDEIARAERFYFQKHRQRFIAGRGILRTILGRYLSIEPQKIRFDYQLRGKPVLADTFADSGLVFNLSHSQNLGLFGVNCTRQIGVDLEYIRPVSDLESLAKRFFLAREYAVLRSLSPNQQQEVFFRYWTCKEAYLKATGDGLVGLEHIEVLLTPTEPATLQTSEDWGLVELVPAKDYVAAVAVAGLDWHLKCWQY